MKHRYKFLPGIAVNSLDRYVTKYSELNCSLSATAWEYINYQLMVHAYKLYIATGGKQVHVYMCE